MSELETKPWWQSRAQVGALASTLAIKGCRLCGYWAAITEMSS